MQSSNKAAFMMLFCTLISISSRSFVATAPIGTEGTTEEARSEAQDTSVKELENLKHSLGNIQLMKSQSHVYEDINDEKKALSEMQADFNENGKLVARVGQHVETVPANNGEEKTKVQTNVDIPSEGIHKSVVHDLPPDYPTLTENGNRRSISPVNNLNMGSENVNTVEKVDNLSGVQYSPLDMAEYVFWTGDEKGVTLAIEEFLQEGLMTREEAIAFLQEIKYNLEYLKGHYTQLGLNGRERSKDVDTKQQQQQQPEHLGFSKSRSVYETPELRNSFDINQLRQEVSKKRAVEPASVQTLPVFNKPVEAEKAQQEDYDELLERLRVADFLYTEYSLEEVIYQLAKVMFTQSLTRGSTEAQQALQKFTNFLEMEAEQGHISRALEKKVLDVLIASLSDTLTEHPELLAAARESLDGSSANSGAAAATNAADGHHFIRQILDMNVDSKQEQFANPADFYTFKSQQQANRNNHAMDGKLIGSGHVPIGLGKYKNP